MKLEMHFTMNAQDVKKEDGGAALIFSNSFDSNSDKGMFVRIQSWDETDIHEDMNKFIGKKCKLTLEILNEK